MPAFPASLPKPWRGSVTISEIDTRLAFRPDGAQPLFRRRVTSRLFDYVGRLRLTDSERATLDTFYSADCLGGVLEFTMMDWDVNHTTSTFLFVDPPRYTHDAWIYWHADLHLLKLA